MSFKYLASPYTSPSREIMQARFEEAERCLAWLLGLRIWCYAPIVHCHQLALNHKLPPDHAFWRDYDRAMILSSSGVLVLKSEGWTTSKGVSEEIDFARQHHVFVRYIKPLSDGLFALENFG
jgi:hypothetical protein